jgi:hypothetical protein
MRSPSRRIGWGGRHSPQRYAEFDPESGTQIEYRRYTLPIMKLLRTLFILLLCAVLPLSGLAASGTTGDCPMQYSAAMAMDGDMSAMPGCDTMKSASPGKAKGGFCKMTAQCLFASLYYPPASATVSHPMSVGSEVVFHYAQSFPVREPGGFWRPPRNI